MHTNLDLSLIHISRKVRNDDFLRALCDGLGRVNGGRSCASTLDGRDNGFAEDLSASSASTTTAGSTTRGLGLGGDDLENFCQQAPRVRSKVRSRPRRGTCPL